MTHQDHTDLLTVLNAYADLQVELVTALQRASHPQNWDDSEALRHILNGSELQCAQSRWTLTRHGLGCRFVRNSDGLTVDAKKKLGSEPHGLDTASIEDYLESQGARHVFLFGERVLVEFGALKAAMEELVSSGKLRKLDSYNRYEVAQES